MSAPTARVAGWQFAVSGDIRTNSEAIERGLREAAGLGADLLLTSEAALSGYAGADFESFEGFDWALLRAETARLQKVAAELGLWLVLGSAHDLAAGVPPTNCLYLVSPEGTIVDRYDKSFLTGFASIDEVPASERDRFSEARFPFADQAHYSAGDRLVDFEIGGVRFGLGICYDMCWPQLFIAYRERGVQVMLHAFHNVVDEPTCLVDLTVRQAPTRCADNRMWAVCTNSAAPGSQWGSFVARPDATIPQQLVAGAEALLVHDFPDTISATGWMHNDAPLGLAPGERMHRGAVWAHPRRLDPTAAP